MALKFLNKKGWHTGSLRNIETVWKAEQKHENEQKKLEELRKQIQDEREKSEFRLMQEQAGLVPKQERLEFLYDSGLQVGKVAQADEYLLGKPVEEAVQPESNVGQVAAKPGALFVEEKPASANDSWRKLHSDPLFAIRQREQEAIAKIKSNPVKMAQIKKAAELKKKLKEEKKKKRKEAKLERREKKNRKKQHRSSSEDSSDSDDPRKGRKLGHGSDADADADGGHTSRARVLSRSVSRSPTSSPVRNDRRQSPRKLISDRKSKGSEDQEFEKRTRDPSRSPSRSLTRSAAVQRSPVRRDREQRFNGSRDRDYEKRKRVPSRSPSRSRSRSPVRRVPLRKDRDPGRSSRGDFNSRDSYTREGRYGEYKDSDQRQKGSEDRDYGKGKRVQSRSLSRSPSRKSTQRDYDLDRSRRDNFASRGPYSGEGRYLEHRDSDGRLKGPEDRDHVKRKRVSHRSPSRSPSSSPVHRRDYGQSGLRRGELDSKAPSKGDERYKELHLSDQRSKRYEDRDTKLPYTKEPERKIKSPSNGSVDDLRNTKLDAIEKRLVVEDQVVGRKDINSENVLSKPASRGRPPKPGQLSDAERAARLREMQVNADIHEEQRWQRLKRAADADAVEIKRTINDKSNEQFIADTQKSMFGSEGVSASAIEKSVKRRAHFIERSSAENERNAFRR